MKRKISLGQLKKYIFAGVIGNGLEWYDFVIFGYFSPILARQFFPSSTPTLSLIQTFALFAVAFLCRPLGAYFFGRLGDQYGRKTALQFSILLMAISTSLMGLLPTYYDIGVAAPCFLTLLRILQGLSLGGEITSSLSFLFEHSPQSQRGLVGAWIYSGGFLGSILGASTSLLLTAITTQDQLYGWGWRIPFLLGFILTFFGYYVRRKLEESPLFLELKRTSNIEASPLKTICKNSYKEMLQVIGTLLPNILWIYLFVFMSTYLIEAKQWPFASAVLINLVPSALFFLFVPIAGYFSDIWGRKKTILIGQSILTLLTPLFLIVFAAGSLMHIIYMQVLVSMAFALAYGPTAALLAEMFPTPVRNTGMALSYHIVSGIFGGLTPLVLTFLISWLGIILGPLLLLMPAGLIGVFAIRTCPPTALDYKLATNVSH